MTHLWFPSQRSGHFFTLNFALKLFDSAPELKSALIRTTKFPNMAVTDCGVAPPQPQNEPSLLNDWTGDKSPSMNGGKPSYTSTWSVKQLMRSSLKVRVIWPLLSTGGGEGPKTTMWLLLLNEEISHRQLAFALFATPPPNCVEMKPWVTLVRMLRVSHSWKHKPPFLQLGFKS